MTRIDWRIDDEATLRSLEATDAEVVYALVDANRARLSEWMNWVEGTRSPDDILGFIEGARGSEHDLEANGIWIGDRIAGSMGMRVDPLNRSGEIGFWLGAEFEGRGLVTRACRLMIDHSFNELGFHRISLTAGVENRRSRAVAERLGFREEGVIRGGDRVAGGRYVDLISYGLLEHEWSA